MKYNLWIYFTQARIDLLLIHLAIADLFVTFFLMPLEVGWAATVRWMGGDVLCRVMAFFRVFGLFLSSNILICISLNRYAYMPIYSNSMENMRNVVYLTLLHVQTFLIESRDGQYILVLNNIA